MAHLGPHLEGGLCSTVLIYQCRKGIVKILLWGQILLNVGKKRSVYVKENMMAFFVISTFKVLSTFSLDLSQRERWMG